MSEDKETSYKGTRDPSIIVPKLVAEYSIAEVLSWVWADVDEDIWFDRDMPKEQMEKQKKISTILLNAMSDIRKLEK